MTRCRLKTFLRRYNRGYYLRVTRVKRGYIQIGRRKIHCRMCGDRLDTHDLHRKYCDNCREIVNWWFRKASYRYCKARQRGWRMRHPGWVKSRWKRYYRGIMGDPEKRRAFLTRRAEYHNRRYWTDPRYREMFLRHNRDYYRRRLATDPTFRRRLAEYQKRSLLMTNAPFRSVCGEMLPPGSPTRQRTRNKWDGMTAR